MKLSEIYNILDDIISELSELDNCQDDLEEAFDMLRDLQEAIGRNL